MGTQENRRAHQRAPLGLTAICQKVGQLPDRIYSAKTVNVSSGGMLLEINRGDLHEGQLLSVEMSIPPTEGLLEFGGTFSSYARVIRVEGCSPCDATGRTHRIALEFCRSPKLQL